MEKIAHSGPAKPIGPYSTAIEIEGFLFVSGQIPLKEDGSLLTGDIEKEAKLVLENIRKVLSACKYTLDDVVKSTIFLKDMGDFPRVNEVYGRYFQPPYPARSTVEVANLPRSAKIEIEVIAYKER
jgi:2-iminobutanoate/2-iminopropanoate deaminase